MNNTLPQRNKLPGRGVEQSSGRLSGYFGITVGTLFIVSGVLILLKVLGRGWWIDSQIRIILGITIILFGIFRIVQYSIKLHSLRKAKSLKEQIDELDKP
ncbi:MAG: hypothetical protein OEM52_14035 [bacterium]|nr:hypothetical protein [bacterium]